MSVRCGHSSPMSRTERPLREGEGDGEGEGKGEYYIRELRTICVCACVCDSEGTWFFIKSHLLLDPNPKVQIVLPWEYLQTE